MCLTNCFINQEFHERIKTPPLRVEDEEGIIVNGKFNMQICLEKFSKYYHEYYSDKDIKFIKEHSRYFFIFFISSVLNGHGFVHLESQTTNYRRRDIIVNYLGQQFIIELKIWRGDKAHDQALTQLFGYMSKKSLNEGYFLCKTVLFRNCKKIT